MPEHKLILGAQNQRGELDVAVIIPVQETGGIIILPLLTVDQIREIVDRLIARKQQLEESNG